MEKLTDSALLTKIEAFLKSHDMAPSRFGILTMGDGALITGLRAGRSPSLKNANRIIDFMATYSERQEA